MTNYSTKIKQNLNHIIKEMNRHPQNFVHHPEKDFTRIRKLSFEKMMNFILAMNGNSLYKELMDHFNHDVNTPTTSAFIQQRSKIKSDAFKYLFKQFTASYDQYKYFKGYRLLAIDGSTFSIAHHPNDEKTYIKGSSTKKGYNSLHLNALYDIPNKLYIDAQIQPIRELNERQALIEMVTQSKLKDPVIIVADRGYESYNTFAHIEEKGWNYVIRVKDIKSKSIVSSLSLPDQDEFDSIVHLTLTRKQTNEVKSNPNHYKFLPNNARFDYFELKQTPFYPISFRVVRLKLTEDTYETLITNLDSVEFPKETLKDIYQMRWGIETSFRELKYAIGIAVSAAFFGGLAGIIGQTREDKVSNVIPGVAIATALMPPLCTCGYSIANGRWDMLLGAGYLFLLNTYFIFLSAGIILSGSVLALYNYKSPNHYTIPLLRLNLYL